MGSEAAALKMKRGGGSSQGSPIMKFLYFLLAIHSGTIRSSIISMSANEVNFFYIKQMASNINQSKTT